MKKTSITKEAKYAIFNSHDAKKINTSGTVKFPAMERINSDWLIPEIKTFNIKKIKVPFLTRMIGNQAFKDFKNLESCTLSKSIKVIGAEAFTGTNISQIELTNVEIIDSGAFANCKSLRFYNLGKKLNIIADAAFQNTSIKHLYCGKRLKTVGRNAFANSPRLLTADFRNPNCDLYESLFLNCNKLKHLYLPKNLVSIEANLLSGCTNLRNFNFPQNVKTIKENAFNGCKKITKINLGKKVINISEGAFLNCNKLSSIKLPETIRVIGDYALYNTNVNEIVVPNSCYIVGENSFDNYKYAVKTKHGVKLTNKKPSKKLQNCTINLSSAQKQFTNLTASHLAISSNFDKIMEINDMLTGSNYTLDAKTLHTMARNSKLNELSQTLQSLNISNLSIKNFNLDDHISTTHSDILQSANNSDDIVLKEWKAKNSDDIVLKEWKAENNVTNQEVEPVTKEKSVKPATKPKKSTEVEKPVQSTDKKSSQFELNSLAKFVEEVTKNDTQGITSTEEEYLKSFYSSNRIARNNLKEYYNLGKSTDTATNINKSTDNTVTDSITYQDISKYDAVINSPIYSNKTKLATLEARKQYLNSLPGVEQISPLDELINNEIAVRDKKNK